MRVQKSITPCKIKTFMGFDGIISPMNPLTELDQLNLEPAAKTQVAAMLQALIEQAVRNAQTIANQQERLQAKETVIQAKDLKIAALTHELA